MDPQHPQHQPLPRPSLFAASHDPRAAPPPRQYGPASSLHNVRSQPVYDRLGRRENETTRPPPYGYPSHSYAHEKPLSPVPFASLRNDAPNGFHAQPSSRGSLMKAGDGGLKDHGTLYREGRATAVLFRLATPRHGHASRDYTSACSLSGYERRQQREHSMSCVCQAPGTLSPACVSGAVTLSRTSHRLWRRSTTAARER
ncbi:hypothetical protein VTN00DRAFT_6948 [Thermoascus crustaceus]|uniref:uncharacterized protein n=1 Tax=Thermoascus crustaceus TaxID=5088 RepID=UPI0037432E8B